MEKRAFSMCLEGGMKKERGMTIERDPKGAEVKLFVEAAVARHSQRVMLSLSAYSL